MNHSNVNTRKSALGVLISVFFFWGFVAASNDILIPVFKEKLNLKQWQSQMISFAFYVAYTIGSLIYYALSKVLKKDLLNRMGYKNGIALGLTISAIGTFMFYPAAALSSFPLMISGLFIVGLGFSLQQTAANPLAIVMGDPKKGSQRLSLAGGINNLGTTIGPFIVSYAIFGSMNSSAAEISIDSIKLPYMILGLAFLLVALVFKFSSIPNTVESISSETISPDKSRSPKASELEKKSALNYPQLWMGMIAIFLYVGVEVSTASNLPEFMKQELKYTSDNIAPFVSLFWASLMIGRWTGSVGAFSLQLPIKRMLQFLMPYVAFMVFILINLIAGKNIQIFYPYFFVILVLVIGDILSKGNPSRQLLLYSLFGIVALFVGMLSSGYTSVFAFISVGLFCSTLWPCIFTLAIAGLGKYTNEGSGFLIMMIMGGGFISLLQGVLAEQNLLGIQWSYMVGVACFTYLAFYAFRVSQILKSQGIDTGNTETVSH